MSQLRFLGITDSKKMVSSLCHRSGRHLIVIERCDRVTQRSFLRLDHIGLTRLDGGSFAQSWLLWLCICSSTCISYLWFSLASHFYQISLFDCLLTDPLVLVVAENFLMVYWWGEAGPYFEFIKMSYVLIYCDDNKRGFLDRWLSKHVLICVFFS